PNILSAGKGFSPTASLRHVNMMSSALIFPSKKIVRLPSPLVHLNDTRLPATAPSVISAGRLPERQELTAPNSPLGPPAFSTTSQGSGKPVPSTLQRPLGSACPKVAPDPLWRCHLASWPCCAWRVFRQPFRQPLRLSSGPSDFHSPCDFCYQSECYSPSIHTE